ncbi:MAG: hypothetical protein AB8B53_06135 [Flavobacteriales bacterium]
MQAAITAFITILILGVLVKKSNKSVPPSIDDTFVLKVIKLYLYLGIFLILAGLAMLALTISLYFEDEPFSLIMISLLMGGVWCYGGFYCFLLERNYMVLYDSEKIEVTNFKNKKQTLKWAEISTGKFSAFTSSLKVSSRSSEYESKTLLIHQHTKGIGQFMKIFIEKTGITLKETRMPIKLD